MIMKVVFCQIYKFNHLSVYKTGPLEKTLPLPQDNVNFNMDANPCFQIWIGLGLIWKILLITKKKTLHMI